MYRIFIIGSLIGIVIVAVWASLRAGAMDLTAGGQLKFVMVASLSCLTPFMLILLGYWWWQILFEGYVQPASLAAEAKGALPGVKALRSWTTLFEAMAAYGGDADALARQRRAGRRGLIEWFAWASLIALWPLGAAWLYALGFLSQGGYRNVALGILVLVILMLVRTYTLLGRGTAAEDDTIFKPLGLARLDTERVAMETGGSALNPLPAGASLVGGHRHDRSVLILIDGGHTITTVHSRVPEFRIISQEGKLSSGASAPVFVYRALKRLRKATRWQGVDVQGSAEGLKAERVSRGRNMWLYDLWLIERLLEEFETAVQDP